MTEVSPAGRTAAHRAAYGGYTDVLELLLDNNADPSIVGADRDTTLQAASLSGDAAKVDRILKRVLQILEWRNKLEKTALHEAAERGRIGAVRILLEYVQTFQQDMWLAGLRFPVQL